MPSLKQYFIINDGQRYREYCKDLYALAGQADRGQAEQEAIELLTFLIERYDMEHHTALEGYDPVDLVKSLMKSAALTYRGLAAVLGTQATRVSALLHRIEGLSPRDIRKLCGYFGVRRDELARPYRLRLLPVGIRNAHFVSDPDAPRAKGKKRRGRVSSVPSRKLRRPPTPYLCPLAAKTPPPPTDNHQ